jgi:acetylornithine/succinyldiaminopimelate/putrescine aminotransferase
LGEKLCAISCRDRVFFYNAGAEANETMIMIAGLPARDIDTPCIVVMATIYAIRTCRAPDYSDFICA